MGKPVEEILKRFEKEYKELQGTKITCPKCRGTGIYRVVCDCGCGEVLADEACFACDGDGQLEEK